MPRPLLAALCVAAVLLAVVSAPAGAKIPDARHCTIPDVLTGSPAGAVLPSCAGRPGSAPERTAGFRLVLRDINNAALWFEPVTLDLSKTGCRVYADDRPGTTVDCAARTIRRLTDQFGVVEFAPRFSGGCVEALAMVMADGFAVKEIPARSTDLDSDGTTGLLDFSRVARNYLDDTYDPATDLDPCAGEPGRTTLADFVLFGRVLLESGEVRGVTCP